MRRYWKYLCYVIRHKYFVFAECAKHGLIWRGLMHDLSKFLPEEFVPYARYFYHPDGRSTYDLHKNGESNPWKPGMDRAWLFHQKRNPHHHQYWVLREDSGAIIALDMPDKNAREMICDWKGAGMALGHTGADECSNWYQKNKSKMILSERTRRLVEKLLTDWKY